MKNIRQKYRQAVDSGRKSGHGRVVMLYFEICQSIWGASPATEQIEIGLESTDLTNSATDTDDTTSSAVTDDLAAVASNESTEEDIIHRRNLLDKQLQEHRHSKLKRKLPVDVLLLACAQEELKMKKQLMEHMERAEDKYLENMARLSLSMEHLTNSITEGFSLIKNIINPRQQTYHDSSYYSQN